MMLHRHFEKEGASENMTKLKDISGKGEGEGFVSEIFPPDENTGRQKRSRKKTEE